jgi:hypothetical protein
MALSLVIDTVNWKKLVSKIEIERNLYILKHLVVSGQVKLLLPIALKEEWEKHREIERKILRSAVNNHIKRANLLNIQEEEQLEKEEQATNLLESQITMVEDLLSLSMEVPESDAAINIIFTHSKTAKKEKKHERLPPFQNKIDSQNDARIIFTTLDFVKENGINDLVFLSENTDDFGSPLDPENTIHPGIASVFPSITIHYFSGIAKMLSYFEARGMTLKAAERTGQAVFKNIIRINRQAPVLDQLYEYLQKRFHELYILPKHLIVEHYPFLTGTTTIRDQANTLFTDNETIYNLLSGADNASLSDTDKTKMEQVILLLLNNNLTKVSMHGKPDAAISWNFGDLKTCNCPLCLYRSMDLLALSKKLEEVVLPEIPEEKIRLAFCHYLMGNLSQAITILKTFELENIPVSHVSSFLVKINLRRLGNLLDFYGEQTHEAKIIAAPLQAIDLDQQFALNANIADQPVLDWLKDHSYHRKTLNSLLLSTTHIRDLFNSKSSGGHEDTLNLLETFQNISDFIHQNGLVSDFGGFTDSLTSAYMEGIFASLACHPNMGGKLAGFTDTIIENILLNVNAEILHKYSNRYKVRRIASLDGAAGFHTKWQTLFTQFPVIAESYSGSSNNLFLDRYRRIIITAFSVFSLLETTDEQTALFCTEAVKMLSGQTLLHFYKAEAALMFFIDKKKKQLSTDSLLLLFDLWLLNPRYRTARLLGFLADVFLEKGIAVNISDRKFDLVKQVCYKDAAQYNEEEGWTIMCDLSRILNRQEQKKMLQEYAEETLNREMNSSHYYEACIYGLLDPLPSLTEQYFHEISSLISKGKKELMWWNETYFHDRRIDEFFNFCFKYNITIPDDLEKSLAGFDPYYNWLLDMEVFDYTSFNAAWIQNYFSFFFKVQYRKSIKLKEFLMKYIRENFDDTDTQRTFMFIYGFDD